MQFGPACKDEGLRENGAVASPCKGAAVGSAHAKILIGLAP